MKFNPIFGFIAATVFLFASSVSAYPDITGTWYVHSLTGGVWVHHPAIRSWNFTISKSPEPNQYKGLTIYVEDESNEKSVEEFVAVLHSDLEAESYHFSAYFRNDIGLEADVEPTEEGMNWAVSEGPYSLGIIELRREPAPKKVAVYFGDDDGFDNMIDYDEDENDDDDIGDETYNDDEDSENETYNDDEDTGN